MRAIYLGLMGALLCLSGCSPEKKPAAKLHREPSVSPVPLDIAASVDYASIRGTNPMESIQHIGSFPFGEYKVFGVHSSTGIDYFCVDPIPDYIKNEVRKGLGWEVHLAPYILRYCKPGSLAIDVGAHIGSHTVTMSRSVGSSGRVIAIEPQPKTFRELVVNMALNQADNISFFRNVIGSSFGQMYLASLNPANEGATGPMADGRENAVEMIPLDSLRLTNVSLIKIDVEGMELAVLEGAKETIRNNKPVLLIEICGGVRPETASCEEREEIRRRIAYLETMGYEVIRICDLWDYLAVPKGSKEFKKIAKTKMYRKHLRMQQKLDTL